MADRPTGMTDRRAVDVVVGVLPRAAKVEVPKGGDEAHLVVGGLRISVKWVGEGTLGHVRRSLDMWAVRPDVVVARRLSPGARELLSEAGIGWADETGAAEIATGSIIVARTGRPPKAPERDTRWTPAVLAVTEALLCGSKATVAAAEAAPGLSAGSCVNALRVLTDLGLLEASVRRGRGSARRVRDPERLLDAYCAAVAALSSPISLHVGVIWRDPVAGLEDVGRRWDKAKLDWAATGAVAASVLAPYLASVTAADVYVGADTVVGLERAAADAGLRPIEGGRLTLRSFPTVAVRRLAQKVDGLRVAPWPRVYVDLLSSGVRGEDAAEHLREVVHAR